MVRSIQRSVPGALPSTDDAGATSASGSITTSPETTSTHEAELRRSLAKQTSALNHAPMSGAFAASGAPGKRSPGVRVASVASNDAAHDDFLSACVKREAANHPAPAGFSVRVRLSQLDKNDDGHKAKIAIVVEGPDGEMRAMLSASSVEADAKQAITNAVTAAMKKVDSVVGAAR